VRQERGNSDLLSSSDLKTGNEALTESGHHPMRTEPITIIISPGSPVIEEPPSPLDELQEKFQDGASPDAAPIIQSGAIQTTEDGTKSGHSVQELESKLPETDVLKDQQLASSAFQADLPASGDEPILEASAGATPLQQVPLEQSLYKVKMIKWKDASVPIITQNENGPCPLIAIINVLLLKAKVNPFGSKTEINADDLMDYLGDFILTSAPKDISDGDRLDYEQNMQDAFSVFPKLQTGLDVNVKFTGVRDFEYTPECIIFDLLNIPLYHGWLVDPQAKDAVTAVSKLSYNQLVEKIITNKSSPDNDLVTEALIAENFLERTASQLTYHGLYELNALMKPDEMAVLFRNNHFIAIHKHKSELFQLVTDQGFLHESNVIWETLSNIEGDGLFVDSTFVTVPPKPAPPVTVAPNTNLDEAEQIKQDYLVALSLQEEQKRAEEKALIWQEYKEKELGATEEMTDEQLARRLQEEEQKQVAQAQAEGARAGSCSNAAANRQPQPHEDLPRQQPPPKKKSDCAIL